MFVGTITVDPSNATHSGSGAAYSILDTWWVETGSNLYSNAETSTVVAVKEGMGSLCSAIAGGMITHMSNYAEVTVTIASNVGGLQTFEGSNTDPPATEKTLPGTIE